MTMPPPTEESSMETAAVTEPPRENPEGRRPAPSAPRELYLDLLKGVLTNTLLAAEPDANEELEARYIAGFIKHYINGAAVSMLPLARLENLQACVLDVIERGIPGDLIETGVWR